MSETCIPVSRYDCNKWQALIIEQQHDWFTATLTFGLCFGLIISYAPQVSFIKSPGNQSLTCTHGIRSLSVSSIKDLLRDSVHGISSSAVPRQPLVFSICAFWLQFCFIACELTATRVTLQWRIVRCCPVLVSLSVRVYTPY